MEYKVCPRCGEKKIKDIKNFINSRGKASSWCRKCKQAWDRVYSRRYREEYPEWKKEDNRRHQDLINKGVKEWQKNNPHKFNAQKLFAQAVRQKKIQRKPCVICGEPKTDGHHYNYNKPLSVIWLCHKHHKQLHAGIIKL